MSSSSSSVRTQIQVNNVLRHELETLKQGRKVYVQQPGSLVFFKSDKEAALKDCQDKVKSLQREYEQMENQMDQSN